MKLKLALIFSILVVGFILFAPVSFNPLKDRTIVIDKVEENFDGLKDGIDNTIDNIGKKFDNVKNSSGELFSDKKKVTGEQESEIAEEYTYHGEVTEDEQVPTQDDSGQNNGITPQDDSGQNNGITPQDDSGQHDATSTDTSKKESESIDSEPSAKEVLQTKLLKTLQLTTTQEDNGDVKVKYSDNSGNTISVKFTLKNFEKVLFSGTFFASNFETSITDISNTDHIIEMIIEHKEFGTITSSVYKPAGNLNSMINGVFMTP